jgi:hypothetical protein
MSQRATLSEVDRQVVALHKRFTKAMDDRLTAMTPDIKDSYFALLSKLVAKLETGDKPLREIAQEMLAESMSEVLQMVQG